MKDGNSMEWKAPFMKEGQEAEYKGIFTKLYANIKCKTRKDFIRINIRFQILLTLILALLLQ